ncbi:MAG: hypothetical protein H0U74_06055 [Bradymonadaceae bacterium]|nr:hypothetical protein [Lujinxingiaceae bacterium]
MANANIVELTTCLDDALVYCQKHPEREHVQVMAPRLAKAKRDLLEGIETTDAHFTHWRDEAGSDRLAWKHLANQLATLQRRLASVNAVGYPDQYVMYWDTEPLQAAVVAMVSYLRARTDQISFAQEQIDKLERQLERCEVDDQGTDAALRTYRRYIQLRADGIREAGDNIGAFRRLMRRELGTEHAEYKSIRWPFSIASDDHVL